MTNRILNSFNNFFFSVKLLLNFINLIEKKRIYQLQALLVLSLISSFAEIISISTLIPLIQVLLDPQNSIIVEKMKEVFNLNINLTSIELKKTLVVIFILSIIFSYSLKIIFLYFSNYLSFSIGHRLNVSLFEKILNKNYNFFLKYSSADFLSNLIKTESIRTNIFLLFNIISSCIISISIIVFALYLIKIAVFISGVTLLLTYVLIFVILKNRISTTGKIISESVNQKISLSQESFLNIRDITLGKYQNYFLKKFEYVDKKLKKNLIINSLYSSAPGYFILVIATILLTLIMYYFSISIDSGGLQSNLPFLGALILSAQRLVPQLQNIYSSIVGFRVNSIQVKDVYLFFKEKEKPYKLKLDNKKIFFRKTIKIINGSFNYNNNNNNENNTLKNINITIRKNKIYGIYGSTGSGKSTLLDLICGLLPLKNGRIYVDEKMIKEEKIHLLRNKISYVSQFPSILNDTITSNIAFGVEKKNINFDKINKVIKSSNLDNFIKQQPKGIDTIIGERGIRISGGQKQRLAIARALYSNKEILLLDEATNALDEEIERKIINNLKSYLFDKTIIIISHRKSIIKNIDNLIEVKNNTVYNK
jgi:ABC-type multidrug transport system fused ATPase/permease subunit